ncbi:TPA: invasin domain 3-containing protein [Salmonella enterica subsp. enterica serovar Birkenhead]|uniref:invasin domain 3-containing protein n=1 Tax=Salmonella enterica TaxID=28901 RepID=UPI0012A94591|nr:invasin domain 3-containing protein [Salmonella enterica]EBY7195575.1 hypothetical protein [Salmonella enterica subsp. enterica serovar Birkenhead]EDV0048019.1 hypothetical protein [Salmonella enterica subsp. enterica serovar Birkenhead]EHI3951246.1 hypothetical protein [Salmonella enterica]EHI6135492.1 hypothetical protein [Salmonella enterica]EHI7993769.1 hypothetical protein [Salmonella enterica]
MTKAHFLKSPVAIFVGTVLLVPAAQAVTDTTVPVTGHPPVVAPKLSTLTPNTGDSVSVSPNFTDPDGDAEDTTATGTAYQWQVEGTAGSGNYTDITGQTGKDYIIQATDSGKKLRVMVTPRTAPILTEPFTGQPTASDIAQVTGAPDAAHSTLTVTTTQANNTITADDGTSTDAATRATLTLTLHDVQDKPVKGQSPTFVVTPADPGVKISAVKDNLDGTYTATLTGTKAQDYNVAPQLTGTVFGAGQTLLEGKASVIAAALDGPASKVIIPVDAALEGTILAVEVYLKDRFGNDIDPQKLPVPEFTYNTGEKFNPSSSRYVDHVTYNMRPAVVTDASRTGTLTVKMPDGTELDSTEKTPRSFRWTPLLVVSAVGENSTQDCTINCDVVAGVSVHIESKAKSTEFIGVGLTPPSGFTISNMNRTNVTSSGEVEKNTSAPMSISFYIKDSLTGVTQKVSGRGSMYVAYGFKGWASNDADPATAAKAAEELCQQVGATGASIYGFDVLASFFGKKILMSGQKAGPRVNVYGGGHDTIEYKGILNTSQDNGWWASRSVSFYGETLYLQVSPSAVTNVVRADQIRNSGRTPVKGTVCYFD